jgi:A/G-specific adenine glycosylase
LRETPKSSDLLDWYDSHARVLPWRVSPIRRGQGEMPDPYRVWLSEIMLQQTTVVAVIGYFERFATLWPTVADLAAAPEAEVMGEWAGLGYYARARNLVKCARLVSGRGGFPDTRDALMELPGIGPYTSAAIAAIAFDRPETVVDGNVERVMARLHDIHTPLPQAKPELVARAAELTPKQRPGDYAQAVMDLGATICTPRDPACGICPWREPCKARQAGTAADLPRKTAKKPKPVRYGILYLARRQDGAWLLETRPATGLLGGMIGWPGSDWGDTPLPAPPIAGNWQEIPGEVRHTFTHFHLRLRLVGAVVGADTEPERGEFCPPDVFRPARLPTVMRKAYDLGRGWFTQAG